jgi:hypothetical protein
VRRIVKATLILVGVATGLGSVGLQVGAEEKRLADGDVAARVQKRVQEWQPTAEDRRFDEIGWVQGIREAERLAKDNNRPVFLFTHDGHMAVGRC